MPRRPVAFSESYFRSRFFGMKKDIRWFGEVPHKEGRPAEIDWERLHPNSGRFVGNSEVMFSLTVRAALDQRAISGFSIYSIRTEISAPDSSTCAPVIQQPTEPTSSQRETACSATAWSRGARRRRQSFRRFPNQAARRRH